MIHVGSFELEWAFARFVGAFANVVSADVVFATGFVIGWTGFESGYAKALELGFGVDVALESELDFVHFELGFVGRG